MSILLADIDATCAALGYSDGQKYVAEADAIQGLKHLIWILRRDLDNHEYRRHLGKSKVLQTDLVYMLPDYINDPEYADVLIRLLVILTNPTLLLYRDGPPKDNHGRKVFMELIDILQGYKGAFTRDKVWTALFGKLQKVLEIDWALRSEEQSLLIERILVLIRNVLQVPANPEAECRADNDASLHDQVIWALHQSGILDLVLFVVSSPDEHQYHLHGLEILCLLYREQTAESLADASLQRSASEKQRDEQELMAARRREKQRQLARPPTGRHSRFGGTYVIRNLKSVSDRDIICHQPLERVMAIDFDREKEQQKRSHRHVREEAQQTRRSAFTVRLCLREYCIEVLRSAYNTLVRQVRRVLERNAGTGNHDDSYLLWAIRFFMEFNRLSGMQLQLVSESLSVQCFHWVLTRMQHNMDMIVSDKKEARLWAKRLHVALLTFRELLQSLVALQKVQDDNGRALFDMLLNNVCYVLEYRETILHLLMNYNEAHSTKAYLRDVVETANIFIKMMEKFCKDSVVVQDKKRTAKRRAGSKKGKTSEKLPQESEEDLANRWAEMAGEMSACLANELQLPEEDQPIPFDAASDRHIDDQKEDCMIRIHKFLRSSKLEHAVALLRAAREVWPENDVFGAMSAAPEDELLLLREIFMHNITTVEEPHNDETNNNEENEADDDEEGGEYEQEDNGMVEKTFKFEDFAKRLLNAKIVRACTVVLADWQQIPTKSLKATVTILHRIAYGCSCPAMLYQAKLFRIFQQVFRAARDPHHEELRRLGVYVVRKFVETAPKNPKIYAELLFYKSVKEANELETGYCDDYEAGTKGTWTEEQEAELRFLFEENQRNPESEMDVIDWLLENLIDKTRTRRGVLKKLRELGLQFKAPTKKSAASVANAKNLWRPEEDEELRSLYDQYRLEEDCLQRIVDEFEGRRQKQAIIKRMIQIHLIADKSEILPQKTSKSRKSHKKSIDEQEAEFLREELTLKDGRKVAKSKKSANKPPKPVRRKIVRTPLDVGTVRMLCSQIDAEKYQAALDWLQEALDEAAEDADEPTEEDDGIPLVPLLDSQRLAVEDGAFQKLLVAVGMQPPLEGMENYWRIPTYLNGADLKLRAKVVAGEEVEINVDPDEGADDEAEGEEEEDEETDSSEASGDEVKENGKRGGSSEDDEEDVFEGYLQRRRQQLQEAAKSEQAKDEPTKRAAKEEGKGKKKSKTKKNKPSSETDDDDDDDDFVSEISAKLKRRKHQAEPSSDEDEETTASNTKGDALFDLLKGPPPPKADSEDGDALNFNSEDYRKRLLELGDSDAEASDDNRAASDNEEVSPKTASTMGQRHRRANVIDSDSEDSDGGERTEPLKGNDGVGDDNDDINTNMPPAATSPSGKNNDVVVDTASNQKSVYGGGDDDEPGADSSSKGAEDGVANPKTNNKRRRHPSAGSDAEGEDNAAAVNSDADEDAAFLVRKKPNATEPASGEEPAKRRRLAIIDDDD